MWSPAPRLCAKCPATAAWRWAGAKTNTWCRRLFIHKMFSSRKQRYLALTVYVGATPERLDALEVQCRSYPGPHATAMYVPLLQGAGNGLRLTDGSKKKLAEVESKVQQLFSRCGAGDMVRSSRPGAGVPMLLCLGC